jgi:hypothetical protein
MAESNRLFTPKGSPLTDEMFLDGALQQQGARTHLKFVDGKPTKESLELALSEIEPTRHDLSIQQWEYVGLGVCLAVAFFILWFVRHRIGQALVYVTGRVVKVRRNIDVKSNEIRDKIERSTEL